MGEPTEKAQADPGRPAAGRRSLVDPAPVDRDWGLSVEVAVDEGAGEIDLGRDLLPRDLEEIQRDLDRRRLPSKERAAEPEEEWTERRRWCA